MVNVIKLVKNATILLFVVLLGMAYYELSDRGAPVTVYRATDGSSLAAIDHHTFFYVAAGFMVISNLLIAMIARVMQEMPLEKFSIPERDFWLEDTDRKAKLREVFVVWIYGFALIINTLVITGVVKIWFTNRGMGGQLYEYGLMALVFLVALVGWIAFIFYRLRIRREEFLT